MPSPLDLLYQVCSRIQEVERGTLGAFHSDLAAFVTDGLPYYLVSTNHGRMLSDLNAPHRAAVMAILGTKMGEHLPPGSLTQFAAHEQSRASSSFVSPADPGHDYTPFSVAERVKERPDLIARPWKQKLTGTLTVLSGAVYFLTRAYTQHIWDSLTFERRPAHLFEGILYCRDWGCNEKATEMVNLYNHLSPVSTVSGISALVCGALFVVTLLPSIKAAMDPVYQKAKFFDQRAASWAKSAGQTSPYQTQKIL